MVCIPPLAQVANLILGDVAALAALGRAPVLCALADARRLLAAAAAAMAPEREHKLGAAAAASTTSDSTPQQRARVQRPVQRPAGGLRQGGPRSQDRHDGSGGGDVSTVDPQLRRQLRLAALHVSSFLLPWANEQPPRVFLDVAQAAADGWQRWR